MKSRFSRRLAISFIILFSASFLPNCGKSNSSSSPVLPPPGELGAVIADGQVALAWVAPANAVVTGYAVLRATVSGGPYENAGWSATANFTDTTVLNGTTYYYVVCSANTGAVSGNSNETSATPIATPTGVTVASVDDRSVTLSWTASKGATGYAVSRSLTSGSNYLEAGISGTANYTDFSPVLINGLPAYYMVRAANDKGVTKESAETSASPYQPGRELCVANSVSQSISVYSQVASGDVAPLRTNKSLTGLGGVKGIAVNPANGEVFVANYSSNSITVFPKNAVDDATPMRTIYGSSTLLSQPSGIAIDATNNEIFVANGNASITVYSLNADGDVAPLRKISGTQTKLALPKAVAVDVTHNEIMVADYILNGDEIITFRRDASGDIAPLRIIYGAYSMLATPRSLFIDAARDELYVANSADNSIIVYQRTAKAPITPSQAPRQLKGNATGLNGPQAVVVDLTNNWIHVVNGDNSLTTHFRTDNGNVAPIRRIAGTTSGLNNPVSLAICK
jgi:DNA-binding beta-propeller fold protein YncE